MKYTRVNLWIPKPIYQYFPGLYILMALIFFAGSSYITFQHPLAPFYTATGGFCLGAGTIILVLRLTSKSKNDEN